MKWILLPFAFLFAACTSNPKTVDNVSQGQSKPAGSSMEAKQLAAEQEAPFVTEVSFKKGSTDLSEASKKQIEKILDKAKATREVEGVKVISWADQSYPSENKGSLPDRQKKLAENRNEKIKDFVNSRNKDWKVELHSMAERPGALTNLLGSSDARIKKSLEEAGLGTKGEETHASKAIVMVLVKDLAE